MARAFNGSNQYLSTASSPVSGSPMTIAGWGKRTGGRVYCSVGVNGGSHRNQLQVGVSGETQAIASGSSGEGIAGSTISSTGQWVHLCGVYVSSSFREAYLNGVSDGTNTTNIGTQNTANTITIGARWNVSIGNFFNGDLAEIGVWNTNLTAAEIASLAKGMTCDKVRPESLVFYAPLVRDLQDISGGLTITNNNAATVATHPRVYA